MGIIRGMKVLLLFGMAEGWWDAGLDQPGLVAEGGGVILLGLCPGLDLDQDW
jgi:hypothetical protein